MLVHALQVGADGFDTDREVFREEDKEAVGGIVAVLDEKVEGGTVEDGARGSKGGTKVLQGHV